MSKRVCTSDVLPYRESLAVAVAKEILEALETWPHVDVERDDEMGDDEWSELRDYLALRGVTLKGAVAYR